MTSGAGTQAEETLDERIARIVAAWPPFTTQQRGELQVLLAPEAPARTADIQRRAA